MVIKTRARSRPRFEYRLSAGLKTIRGVLLFFQRPLPPPLLTVAIPPPRRRTRGRLLNSLYATPRLDVVAALAVFAVNPQRKRALEETRSSDPSFCLLFFSSSCFFFCFSFSFFLSLDGSRDVFNSFLCGPGWFRMMSKLRDRSTG